MSRASSRARATTLPLAAPLIETRLNDLVPQRQGKVRDIFDCGDTLVMVATDRISAFDYVLGSGIPDKGKVLTQLSAFWFERTTDIVANHFLSADVQEYPDHLRRHSDVLQRPVDARAKDDTGADRVRRARLSVRIGLEGIRGHRIGVRRDACRRGCANRIGCPRRSSPRPPRPTADTTSTSASRRPGASSASISCAGFAI